MKHDFKESADFEDTMKFGDFLRKKRRLMGYSQEELAYKFGVKQTTVSSWECDVTSPPIESAREIIRRMGGVLLIVNVKEVDE